MSFTTLFLLHCVMLLLHSILDVGSSPIPLVVMMHHFGRWLNALALVSFSCGVRLTYINYCIHNIFSYVVAPNCLVLCFWNVDIHNVCSQVDGASCICKESVTKDMAQTSTPEPRRKSVHLNSHPFVDNIVEECHEVDKGSDDNEGCKLTWVVKKLQSNILHREH